MCLCQGLQACWGAALHCCGCCLGGNRPAWLHRAVETLLQAQPLHWLDPHCRSPHSPPSSPNRYMGIYHRPSYLVKPSHFGYPCWLACPLQAFWGYHMLELPRHATSLTRITRVGGNYTLLLLTRVCVQLGEAV